MICQHLNNVYGQIRGYGRLTIRRAVAAHSALSQSEVRAMQRRLFSARAADAAERFPAYRVKLEESGVLSDVLAGHAADVQLPVWTRDDQKALFAAAPDPPLPTAFVNATGGSTGQPVKYHVTRESWEWRTAVSSRGYSWACAEEGVPSLYVWGTAVYAPGRVKRAVQAVQHCLERRTFFDSFHFDDEAKARCCEVINRLRPHALVGYAGNLVALANYACRNPGTLTWKSATLVTAAEGLYPGQRELLEEQLTEEVFVSYGSREFMLIGMECSQHGGLHVSADNLYVEVLDDQCCPCAPGETGRIVITDLRNAATPFVRYEIGDLGAMADPEEVCPCGLPFPRLLRVDGRSQEVIRLPGGGELTALFIPHLMKEFEWIDAYQVEQQGSEHITVVLVTRESLAAERLERVRTALAAKVGEGMQIEFRRSDSLQKNLSGKTPIVIRTDT